MKTRIRIGFNLRGRPWPRVQRLFVKAGCADLAKDEPLFVDLPNGEPLLTGLYSCDIDGDDPRLPRLRSLLKREGLDPSETVTAKYDLAELRGAPLLHVFIARAPIDTGGPEYGTEYDLSKACPQCGSGAVQTSLMPIHPSRLPKTGGLRETIYGETLMHAALAEVFKRERVTGIVFQHTCHSKTRELTDWWQVTADCEMPAMNSRTKGIVTDEPPCAACGQGSYYHTAKAVIELVYDSKDVVVKELPDVVCTHEKFGYAGIKKPFKRSRFAHPMLLVKPKVFDLLRREKVKGLEFGPVTVL